MSEIFAIVLYYCEKYKHLKYLNYEIFKMITALIIGMISYILLLIILFFLYRPIRVFDILQRSILSVAGFRYKYLDTKHEKVGYFEGGKGQSVIMIHGFMVHAGNWSTIAPKLKRNNKVIIPDLPGHGKSPWPVSNRVKDLGESITELLYNKTSEQPAVLIGNSMGGAIALRFALSYPERVKKLVLINTAGLVWHLDKDLLLPKNRTNALRKIQALLNKNITLPAFILDDIVRQTTFQFENLLREAMIHEDYVLNEKLKDLAVKTYVLWGEKDELFSKSYLNSLLGKLPNYELKSFPNDAHVPHNSNPKTTLKYLDEILNS